MAVVGSTGWTPALDEAFDYIGGVAAAAKSFFSGMTDEERAKQKAYREDQETAINKYKLEQDKRELVKIQAAVQFAKIKTLVFKYWYVVLIALFLIFKAPVMRFLNIKTKAKRKPRKRSRTTSKRVTKKTPRRTVTKQVRRGGFHKKIHGRTYTDPKKWAAAMKRLRNKK